MKKIAAYLLALTGFCHALPALATQGRQFAAKGNPVLLKGVSLTNQYWGQWIWPQSDTLAAHGNCPMFRYERTVKWFLDSADYTNLNTLGGNVVRYEFNNELFEAWNEKRDSNLIDLKAVLRKLESQGKYTILSMSAAPGLSVGDLLVYEDPKDGSKRVQSVFESDSLEAHWDNVWVWLASKLKGDSAIAGFELINEPRLPAKKDATPEKCVSKYVHLVQAIRDVDSSRLVLIPNFHSREAEIGESYWSSTASAFITDTGEQGVIWEDVWPEIPDSLTGVAMVFHFYQPWNFVSEASGDFTKQNLASLIADESSWPAAHGRPVVVTEYGANYGLTLLGRDSRRVDWYRSVHDIFQSDSISSTVFTFKGEIGPYITPASMYHLWGQYLAAPTAIRSVNGVPSFRYATDSVAAKKNGFDTLLTTWIWKDGKIISRSSLGNGPVLAELSRHFRSGGSSSSILTSKPETGSPRILRRNGTLEIDEMAAGVCWKIFNTQGRILASGQESSTSTKVYLPEASSLMFLSLEWPHQRFVRLIPLR